MPDPEKERRLRILEQGRNLYRDYCEAIGISPVPAESGPYDKQADREMYVEALEDRMRERGLL